MCECVCVSVFIAVCVCVCVCVSLGEECVSVGVQKEGLVHDKTFMRTTTGTLCLSDSVCVSVTLCETVCVV